MSGVGGGPENWRDLGSVGRDLGSEGKDLGSVGQDEHPWIREIPRNRETSGALGAAPGRVGSIPAWLGRSLTTFPSQHSPSSLSLQCQVCSTSQGSSGPPPAMSRSPSFFSSWNVLILRRAKLNLISSGCDRATANFLWDDLVIRGSHPGLRHKEFVPSSG